MLANCRILIVEDEAVIALELAALLRDEGAEIVGIAQTVTSALDFVRLNHISCSLLDIYLHGETSYPVADALSERRLPFAFLTGYTDPIVPARHRSRPVLKKPFIPMEIIETVAVLPWR
jgi:CheY-like chemotaxis protein